MESQCLFAILLLAPLLGFLFNGLRYRSHNAILAGSVATGAAAISFVCSVILVLRLQAMPETARLITADFFNWIPVGDLTVKAGMVLDPISAIMILVITGVGSL